MTEEELKAIETRWAPPTSTHGSVVLRLCATLRAERTRAERAERIAAASGRLRSASYEYSIAAVDRDASGIARADAAAKEAEADLRALGVEP